MNALQKHIQNKKSTPMDYTTLASQESLDKTVASLTARGFKPTVFERGAEAFAALKTAIPQGASVMNGSSVTLEQIGFVDYLKSGAHGWNNMHEMILAEKDPVAQARKRREALISDYYLGSAHALSESGEMIIASNTGSQLPHIVYSSPNVILVVGSQKIVSTVEAGQKRLREHVIPLEEEHMQQKYGVSTALNKEFIYHGENVAFTGRSVQVFLVKEQLGF